MKKIFNAIGSKFTRPTFANLLMASFILFTAIGGFLIAPPIGFLVAGLTCGIFGYILGAE
jgi:LytS/YehU family sensor histidine kinase